LIEEDKKSQNMKVDSDALQAWESLRKYKGIIHHVIDEKVELAQARDEKYKEYLEQHNMKTLKESVKSFGDLPDIFLDPVIVDNLYMYSKDELNRRQHTSVD